MKTLIRLKAEPGKAYLTPVHLELIASKLKSNGGQNVKPKWIENGKEAEIKFGGIEDVDQAKELATEALGGAPLLLEAESIEA